MNNLDDLYQLLVLNQKKKKSAEFKMIISYLITLGGIINPVLLCASILDIYYIVQTYRFAYHRYKLATSIHQSDKYEEYIQLNAIYKDLLHELKKHVLTRLDAKEPMEIFAVYYYMVKNGFLSIDHSFLVESKSDSTCFLCPTSIVQGNGVCRNLASFLTDLLNVNGYSCYNVEMGFYNQEFYPFTNDDYNYPDAEETLIIDKTKKGGLESLVEK